MKFKRGVAHLALIFVVLTGVVVIASVASLASESPRLTLKANGQTGSITAESGSTISMTWSRDGGSPTSCKATSNPVNQEWDTDGAGRNPASYVLAGYGDTPHGIRGLTQSTTFVITCDYSDSKKAAASVSVNIGGVQAPAPPPSPDSSRSISIEPSPTVSPSAEASFAPGSSSAPLPQNTPAPSATPLSSVSPKPSASPVPSILPKASPVSTPVTPPVTALTPPPAPSSTPTPKPACAKPSYRDTYTVKPYLVYPADKPAYLLYETAVKNYLVEMQEWFCAKVGKTFYMEPLRIKRSTSSYLTIRCGEKPSAKCLQNPDVLEGNFGMHMNIAIHNGTEKWDEKTATLVFGAGGGGFAGANKYPNDAGFAITGDWVLEPISGVVNAWGIPCKYSDGWQCAGGVPEGSPAHELGHAFGLPHPECSTPCSIMKWHGDYPTYGFLPSEVEFLQKSPFFNAPITEESDSKDTESKHNYWDSVVNFFAQIFK